MSPSYLPLHWESTGDKWWYASPIDLAAAKGYYDLVRELLHLDMNLLIKLTSLRRIRRLESLWNDDNRFMHSAKCQAIVAHNLLLECETKNNKNSLILAGYGGWLLYTAAAAGDNGFVRELLERDPLLVFGEGEYGVSDILYAAARSKNMEVFRAIFERAMSSRCLVGDGGGIEGEFESGRDDVSLFRWEIVNRAVFAAARGGNMEVLQELLMESSDVLAYRDSYGATIFHASAGRGQVEVVKALLSTFNIVESRDNGGNTALHIAAFRGHLPVVEVLISASSSLSQLKNNDGDTFFHMVAAGFQMPGFRHLDRQMELVRRLVSGNIINIQNIINMQNNNGRTALHVAVAGNLHSDLVELLLAIPSIDINVQDLDGMTPLDLLGRQIRSATSNLLIRRFRSAGGFSNLDKSKINKPEICSQFKMLSGSGNSPGTSFRIADSEIFLHTGVEAIEASGNLSPCSSFCKSEGEFHGNEKKPIGLGFAAARKLRIILRLSNRKEKRIEDECHDSTNSVIKSSEREEIPTPLRQTHSNGASSLLNSKRTVAVRTTMPSPAKRNFAASLMHGVFQTRPQLAFYSQPETPASPFSGSHVSSPLSEKREVVCVDNKDGEKSKLNRLVYSHIASSSSKKLGLMNSKLMNKFFCVEANGLEVKGSSAGGSHGRRVPPVG